MKSKDKQKIGLILVSGDTAHSLRFCSSISRLAKRTDSALFVFTGGMPAKEQLLGHGCNAFILFADPCTYGGSDYIDFSLFGVTPCLLVNFSKKGFFSLTNNVYSAAKDLLEHTLASKKLIACIQGPMRNELAQQCFQAYRDTLAEHSMGLDFKLVSDVGLEELLDHRALVPGVDFDSIYCFGDDQALDIERELLRRGFDIPIVVCASRGGSPFSSTLQHFPHFSKRNISLPEMP